MTTTPRPSGRPRPWTRLRPPAGRAVLALVVLALGFGMTALAVAALQRAQARLVADGLDRRAESVRVAVSTETNRYLNALRDIAAAVGAQQDLTAADFAAITAPITPGRLSGATGISLVVPSRPDQTAAVQQHWRDQGSSGLTLQPAVPGAAEHRFVVLTHSLDPTTTVLGRDATASPESDEAMSRARATGQVTASRTYMLLRDQSLPHTQRQLSFVMTAPVHAVGTAADDDSTAGVFRGWLVMGIRGQDFLAETLQTSSQGQVDVTLADKSPGGDVLVAGWPRNAGQPPRNQPSRVKYVEVAGRTWQLSVHPTERFNDSPPAYATVAVGSAGVIITILLTGLVLLLATARDRAMAQVATATAALRADIIARQHVETELRRRETELRGFAGVVAHDLRSPLAVAAGQIAVFSDDCEQTIEPADRNRLLRAQSALTRMSQLIDDLLDYATADNAALDYHSVDLRTLIDDILTERTSHLDDDSRPTVKISDLPTVPGDPALLRQVFDNLISNGLKYTPHGRPAQLSIAAHPRHDDLYDVTVSDRGIGIPDGLHDTVFDPFHRLRGSEGYPGTGLGLAICKRIIDRHHGTITAAADPAGGTRFTVTLPMASASAAATSPPDIHNHRRIDR